MGWDQWLVVFAVAWKGGGGIAAEVAAAAGVAVGTVAGSGAVMKIGAAVAS